MHITNLFVKSVLSSALTLSSLSIFAAASSDHTSHAEHQHHSGHHAMQNMADNHAQHTGTADASSYQPPKLSHQQQALSTPQNSVSSASQHDHRKEHGAQIYSQIILDQNGSIVQREIGHSSPRTKPELARMKIKSSSS